MGIDGTKKVGGTPRADAAVADAPVQKAGNTQQAQGTVPTPPADLTRTQGALTTGATIGAQGTPAPRQIDLVKLTDRVGKGMMEMKLHLTPGMRFGGARIPEGMYAVIEVHTKDDGTIDYDKSRLRFENAKGEQVKLNRESSIFDVVDGHVNDKGEIKVNIAWSPFDVDGTEALLGSRRMPAKLSEVMQLLNEAPRRANGAQNSGVIDRKDISYSGHFVAKRGPIELAGRSTVEVLADSRVLIKGNSSAGMLQLNTPEKGASLLLESADGNVLRTMPSTLNMRVGYMAEDNSRFFMFDTSKLNDAELTATLDGRRVTFKVGELTLNGHPAPDPRTAFDPRWAALEKAAGEQGMTIPPSEGRGSDIEMQIAQKMIERWPLNDIAAWRPNAVAKLMQDPTADDVPGLYGTFFGGAIASGVAGGLDRVPDFIRDRLRNKSESELAIVVQRAVVADLLRRWEDASPYGDRNAPNSREQLAIRYDDEVRQLRSMAEAELGRARQAGDEAKVKELEGLVARASGNRDPARDFALKNAAPEGLRPGPEMPPFDAFVYKFKRDGSLDENLEGTVIPTLMRRYGGNIPADGVISVNKFELKPGIQPMAFLGLSHPAVKQAMADPQVRALAAEAKGHVETLAFGFALMRSRDLNQREFDRIVTPGMAKLPDEQKRQLERALAMPAGEARAQALASIGEGIFEVGKKQLREGFIALGGMEPNGRGEAFLNRVIDELVKTDGIPQDKKDMLNRDRDKFIGLALNTARAAVWIRTQPNFREWGALSNDLMQRVSRTDQNRLALGSAEWAGELERLTGTRFTDGNSVETLRGPQQFKDAVLKLINDTPKPGPIYVDYWAIYDDTSGKELAQLLARKKQEGYAISVLVDGKTMNATGIGKKEVKGILEAANIPLVTFSEDDPRGNHGKGVTTPVGMVVGGSNFGDEYTHAAPSHVRYSDTNVLVRGPAVRQFADFHESMVRAAGQSMPDGWPSWQPVTPAGGGARVAVLHEKPADQEYGTLLAYMQLLEGAAPGETVRFNNAYFVMTEPVRAMFERALKRGVKIELRTNSAESVDEKEVAKPIMHSARELLRLRDRLGLPEDAVSIYMPKDGSTVHDKEAFSKNVTYVQSYNMHPRSETLEHETSTIIIDDKAASEQLVRWNRYVADAVKITRADDAAFKILAEVDYKDLALEVFKNLF
jgi:phosphatidylserine/phosphatidylglycerophosphate/cardiolipin synthase-like enzyme